jgi:hypothetical protein
MDDSELHLEREESFKDLFDLMQPRSRMEDLVRYYGVREGVICVGSSSPSAAAAGSSGSSRYATPTSFSRPTTTSSRTRPRQPQPQPLPFSSLSISFSPRTIGLVLSTNPGGRKKTIVTITRSSREEKLEVSAKRLVRDLGFWIAGEAGAGTRR